jgi:hypothetical protein
MRLASLYVDPKADLTDLPPGDQVQPDDAKKALALARARLDHEKAQGTPTGEVDELTEWFLDTMADSERSRSMLRPPFIAKYEELNGEPREWVKWVREEMEREDRQLRALAEEELKRPGAAKGAEKPRWRANMTVYTPSHSIRAKVLARWNERLDHVQLLWTGKKDQSGTGAGRQPHDPTSRHRACFRSPRSSAVRSCGAHRLLPVRQPRRRHRGDGPRRDPELLWLAR